jgi:pimeloyl-ACP methyl ester carboxylesterase
MTTVFLHGLESSSKGTKATWFRQRFPAMLIPDFSGPLAERMADLNNLLALHDSLVLVGSSFGGLMATVYTLENEKRTARVILLAPALNFSEFTPYLGRSTGVSARLYIGRRDTVCPPDAVLPLALETFSNLSIHEADDDHLLHSTFSAIRWHELLAT